MFFQKKEVENEMDVGVETRMVMTFIFALAKVNGVKPKDLAKAAVSKEVTDYLGEFTKEFAVASIEAVQKKAKAKK